MKRILILLLCLVMAMAVVACTAEEPQTEEDEVYVPSPEEPEPVKVEKTIAGTIESAEDTDEGVLLLVKAGENERSVYEQAYVLVDGETSVGEIGQYFDDVAASLKTGATITVYTDGNGSDADPPELHAVLITLA